MQFCPSRRRAWFGNVRIRFIALLAGCVLLTGSAIDRACASVAVRIRLSQQVMQVVVDGNDFATWPVPTARTFGGLVEHGSDFRILHGHFAKCRTTRPAGIDSDQGELFRGPEE